MAGYFLYIFSFCACSSRISNINEDRKHCKVDDNLVIWSYRFLLVIEIVLLDFESYWTGVNHKANIVHAMGLLVASIAPVA